MKLTNAPAGNGHVTQDGYKVVREKLEHVLIAEKALGHPLPPGAVVHHWDKNRANNKNSNLLICPSVAYHNLIHARMRAMEACGNANWRCCQYCHQWDDPAGMYVTPGRAYHRDCRRRMRTDRFVAVQRVAGGWTVEEF